MKKLVLEISDLLKERMIKGEIPATLLLLVTIMPVCWMLPDEAITAAEITRGVAGIFNMIILVVVSLISLFFAVAGGSGFFALALCVGFYYLILNANAFFGALMAAVLVSAMAGAIPYMIGYIDESKIPQFAGKMIILILSAVINFGILFGLPLLLV